VTPASLTGGSVATLTITLGGPAPPSGSTVTLSSSGTAFPVPASVVIRAGSNSGELSVRTAAVATAATVTVTAAYNGASKTAGVTVNPAALSSLTVTPSSLEGGSSAVLSVSLSGPAPTGGTSVGLQSSSAAFPVPSSVVIPAGAVSATLEVKTTAVTASVSATITAGYSGVTKTTAVSVTPVVLPSLTSVAATPASLTGGSSATLVITLNGPAPPGGALVNLSSNSASFPVPASITVPDGAKGVDLRVQTKSVTASTPVTVTAAYNNATQTAGITLTPATKR
jgi:hypothetical protein